MKAQELANRLCKDLVYGVYERHGRSFIVTSFRHPDGESINLYMDSDGCTLTDRGHTLYKLGLEHVRMTDSRSAVVGAICANYGVETRGGHFRKPLDLQRIGASCIEFCEALVRISSLKYETVEKRGSELRTDIERVLAERVSPYRRYYTNWVDERVDQLGAFPVDYHFNGVGTARNLFRVSSQYKAALVSAVSHFLKSHDLYVPTMTVVDTEARISTHGIDRLRIASDEIVFGVDAERITEFALTP